MDSSKIIDIIKGGNIVIPLYLLKKYKDIKLELDEFVFLMYLQNFGNKFIFDPSCYSKDWNMSQKDIMLLIGSLSDKGFLQVDSVENEKGFMEERINLDDFYNKLKILVVGDVQKEDKKKKEDADSIYSYLEQKFGRTLSAIDYEIVHAWLENNYNEELIKKAVDEAVSNGVSTLKYIDRILYEWGKKGINSSEDLDKSKKIKSNSKEKKDEDLDLGIMDWDWFDEEE